MKNKNRILICGTLPPPNYGPSTLFKILLESQFVYSNEIVFLNIKFFSYEILKKRSIIKFFMFIKYIIIYSVLIIKNKPLYILYSISFNKKPFLKDFIFIVIGRLFRCKIVQFEMGQYLKELYDSSSLIYKRLILWVLNNIAAIIVMGEKTKLVYSELFNNNHIFVVPHSVADTSRIIMNSYKRRKKHTIQVLYFSLLSESKGLWTALHAIPKVILHDPKIHFVFAGPIESQIILDQMKQFIKINKLDKNTKYIGYIGDELERAKCFRNSDIFIFPTHRDAFGLVILHAMAEGLPVIASIEGNITEVINDKENGFLISKGDVDQLVKYIILLANNSVLRIKIGKTNRAKYLAEYTTAHFGERMINVFNHIKNMG